MSDNTQSNPWITLGRETRHEDSYIRLDIDRVRHCSGKEHPYTAIRFKIFGLTILPIDNAGNTYVVGQYRYLLDRYTWELPRGGGRTNLPPLEAAKRELAEETGHGAAGWFEMPRLTASPGITSEWAPCFVAWGLSPVVASADQQESLSTRRIPFAEAVDNVLNGSIVDAASAALILGAAERARRGLLPEDLIALMRAGGL